METEKFLPKGEPGIEVDALPVMKVLPPTEKPNQGKAPSTLPGMPSPKAQQWGVVISIVIIVLMIVIGAFYAWGQRIAEENALIIPPASE